MSQRETTRLRFNVDAALLVELGERLVAKRSVAIAELIKNAYDADATQVTVSFEKVTGSKGQIVVRDNGSGISMSAMKRAWMRIATTDATVNARSRRFGRPRTGAKGVGRFACGRLASVLSLESVSSVAGRSERIHSTFDWTEFRPGLDLDAIATNVVHESGVKDRETGTTLYLRNLNDTWTERDLSALQAELKVIMHLGPGTGSVLRGHEYEPDPGFDLNIIAPEFPRFEGRIEERFLGAAWGNLKGRIANGGSPVYELVIQQSRETTTFKPPDVTYRHLDDADFSIYMMSYQGSHFKSFGFTLAKARTIGRREGGVRVYLDGFQVFSYGAPGDDWLDLDQDRARRNTSLPEQLIDEAEGLGRPMLLLPGNMQLFGAVSISRDRNPGLAVSLSRERLVHNEGFDELKRFVREGIDWMTVCYARERARERANVEGSTVRPNRAIDVVRSTRQHISSDESLAGDVKQAAEEFLGKVESLLTEEEAAHISELSMLRVLASAGTTVLVFDHTMRAMAGQLLDIVERLGTEVSYLPFDRRPTSEQILDDLRSWSSMATGQGTLVGLLVGAEARTRQASLAVRPLVETLNRGFTGYMSRFSISLENAVPAAVRTPPVRKAELYAILLNLLTNSFKAVRERTERRVRVEADATSRQFVLRVFDTGIGVPPEKRDQVFEPFYTTSQPDPILGIGTGLGLKIVRDIALAWGGDARFTQPTEPWAAAIELAVPFRGSK